ncbi:MAG TPA: hypothetical protein VM509_12280 [Planctomycetota bacterium]|nr:hypothetical protein [Planctomycetota bacterium]
MELTCLGSSSASAIDTAVGLGFDLRVARAEMREWKIARTLETSSPCEDVTASDESNVAFPLGRRADHVLLDDAHERAVIS